MNSTRSSRPELVCERDEVVPGVAVTHEGGLHVVAAEVVAQAGERAQRVVDAVLRSHHAQVADEVAAAAPERLVGRDGDEAREIGRAAHHRGALGRDSTATLRDAAVALVRRDHVVGQPEGGLLEQLRGEQQRPAGAEARTEQLGHQVVVVEDEARAADASAAARRGTAGQAGCRPARRRTAARGRAARRAAASARAPSRTRAGSRRARPSRPPAGSGGSPRPRSGRRAPCRASIRAGR